MSAASTSAAIGSIPKGSDFLPLPEAKPRTLYAELTPNKAKLVFGAYLAAMLFFVAIALSPYRNNAMERVVDVERGDVSLYLDYAKHVREGMGYYEASRLELTSYGYPTGSVFNWRTPLPMWLVGQFPDPNMGRWLIAPFAALLVGFSMSILARDEEGGTILSVLAAILVLTTVSQTFTERVFILPVNWGAVFIGLSICCFAWNRTKSGIALGIVAAILRELALGYSLTMAVYALSQKRWRELAGWCLGIGIYALWFGWHIWMVRQTMGDSVPKPATSWLTLGGPVFVLATAQMVGYLLDLPQWVTAIYLVTGWLGLIGWKTPFGRRVMVAVGAYQLVFLFIGQSFNQYWGVLVAPLLAMGVARGLLSIKELLAAISKQPQNNKDVAPVLAGANL